MHLGSFDDNDDAIISTQEMILDARARREFNIQEFKCQKCDYKSGSKTLMTKHNKMNHETGKSKRIHCNECKQKFNKEETFNKHLKNCQIILSQRITRGESGRSIELNKMKYIQDCEENPRAKNNIRTSEP